MIFRDLDIKALVMNIRGGFKSLLLWAGVPQCECSLFLKKKLVLPPKGSTRTHVSGIRDLRLSYKCSQGLFQLQECILCTVSTQSKLLSCALNEYCHSYRLLEHFTIHMFILKKSHE